MRNYLLIVAIFLSALLIQTHMLLNWDVSFLMHASERFLAGGNYIHQFFETNPPMILYIYTLPVMLAKQFSLGFPQALLIFVFFLAIVTLFICSYLLRKIFPTEKSISAVILSALAVIFLILPLYEFGQREHLLVMLVMPYLFACVLRLQGKPINAYFAIMIGLMAGIGFVIKPYFVLVLMLTEGYLWVDCRKLWGWCRAEVFAILFVYAVYIGSVFVVFPEYIHVVVPLLTKFYYAGFSYSYNELILQGAFLYVALVFIISLYFWRMQKLYIVFSLATGGFAAIYLMERTNWFYHLYPAMSMAVLLSIMMLVLYFANSKNMLLKIVAAVILLAYPVKGMVYVTDYMLNQLNDFPRRELLAFLQKQPIDQWYFLSTNGYAFPVFDYSKQISVSRFANYWWLPGILSLTHKTQDIEKLSELNVLKNYFIDMVVDDLANKKPRWVLVDNRPKNTELHGKNIDYIALFSQNKRFKNIWKSYRYQLDVGYYHVYVLR